MKNNLLKIIALLFLLNSCSFAKQNYYKVIKVIDGDTVYVDFNNNNYPDRNERIRLNGIDAFETKINEHSKYQTENYKLSHKEILGMGYLATKFAKKELLNKKVRVEYSAETDFDKNGRHLMSIYYGKNKNFEQEILKQGLAVIYTKSNLASELEKYLNQEKLKENIKKASELDLVYYNPRNGNHHEIYCKFTVKSRCILTKRPFFKYKKAKCCNKN